MNVRWSQRPTPVAAPEDVSPVTVVLRAPDDELGDVLREAQLALLRFPRLAQALLRAFLEEGRRFAATPDGARWRERLSRSELVRRGQAVWDRSPLGMLDQQEGGTVPSMLVDALVGAIVSGDPSAVASVFEEER
jgi:hypothetical protein